MHRTKHGMDSMGFRALRRQPEARIAGAIEDVHKGIVAGREPRP